MCQNAGHHGQWLKSITALNEDREYHLQITATENRSKNWAKGNLVAAKIYFRRHKIYYHDKNRVYKNLVWLFLSTKMTKIIFPNFG